MSANPGNKLSSWNPTPPQRGAFPLDHFGDCTEPMKKYMECLKLVKNDNAPNCRQLAKKYLDCRMNNELMDRVPWEDLGFNDEPKRKDAPAKKNSKTKED